MKADGIFTEEEAQLFLPEWMLQTDRLIIEKDGRSMCFHPFFRRRKTSSQSRTSSSSLPSEGEESDCPSSTEEEDEEGENEKQRVEREENEEEESISLPRLDSIRFEEVKRLPIYSIIHTLILLFFVDTYRYIDKR